METYDADAFKGLATLRDATAADARRARRAAADLISASTALAADACAIARLIPADDDAVRARDDARRAAAADTRQALDSVDELVRASRQALDASRQALDEGGMVAITAAIEAIADANRILNDVRKAS